MIRRNMDSFTDSAVLPRVPIDDRGMDRSRMSDEEIEMYERYQRGTIEALAGDLNDDEMKWLREYCGQM